MSTENYEITKQGYALLSSLTNTTGKTFKITCAKCSDVPTNGDLGEQTDLMHIVANMTIAEATGSEGASTLRLRIDGNSVTQAFNLYQIGVYAKVYEGDIDPNPNDQGILLQIWQFDPPDIVGRGKQFLKDYIVTVILATTDNIVIQTDSGAYVPYSQFEKLNPKSYICTINHNLNKYPVGVLMQHQDAAGMNGFGIGEFDGSECDQIPVKLVYKDKNNIDVYSTNPVALLGTPEIVVQGNMYHLNYDDKNKTITLILN